MSNLLYIIHPQDSSTDFLEDIHLYLSQRHAENVHVNRLRTRQDHDEIFRRMRSLSNDALYLFLGHGTSTSLSGAITRDFDYPEFISQEQLQVFEGKDIVLLSCRSNQYLRKYFRRCNLKSAIGFPNMITDMRETEYPEQNSVEEVVTDRDLIAFRAIIVDFMRYSLEDYLIGEFSSSQLFDRMRLRINKKLIKFYRQHPHQGRPPLGMILSELVNGMVYFP